MASSAYYSLWLHNGTTWVRVPNFTDLQFNKAMNMIGGMSATIYTKDSAIKALLGVASTPYRIMTAASTNGFAYNEAGGVAGSFIVQQGTLSAPSADQKTETTDGPVTWSVEGTEIAELVTKMTFDNTVTTTDENGTTQLAQPLTGTVGNIIKRSDNNANFGIIDNLNSTLQGRSGATIIAAGTIETGPSVNVKFRQDKAYSMLLDLAMLGDNLPTPAGVTMSGCAGIASDVTGNSRNLTLFGTPASSTSPWAKYGAGINLDGSDDEASSTNSYFNHTGDMSYFFAGRIDTLVSGWVIGSWNSAENFLNTYHLSANSDGSVTLYTAGVLVVTLPAGSITNGENFRIWFTRNATTKSCTVKLFKQNGSVVTGTGTYAGTPTQDNGTNARFVIGHDFHTGGGSADIYNDGAVYEARFWKSVISSATLDLIADTTSLDYYGRLEGTEGAAWFMCGDTPSAATAFPSYVIIDAASTGSAPNIKYIPRVNYVSPQSATYVQPNGITGFRITDPVVAGDATRTISELRNTRAVNTTMEQDRIKNAVNVKYAGGGSTNSTGNSGQLQTGFAVNSSSVTKFGRQEITITAPWVQNSATATKLQNVVLNTYSGLPDGLQRLEITMRRASLYGASGFNANLGDVISLVRKTGAVISGKFLQYAYHQNEERLVVTIGLPDPSDASVSLTDFAATARMNQHSIGSLERVAHRDNRIPLVLNSATAIADLTGFTMDLPAASDSTAVVIAVGSPVAESANAAAYHINGRIHAMSAGSTPLRLSQSPAVSTDEFPQPLLLRIKLSPVTPVVNDATAVVIFEQVLPAPIPSDAAGGSIHTNFKFRGTYPFAISTTPNTPVYGAVFELYRVSPNGISGTTSSNRPSATFTIAFSVNYVPQTDLSHVHNQ